MSQPDRDPRAEPLPPEIDAALAQAAGRRGVIGQQVHWFAELPSTNDRAAWLAEHLAPEGTVVIADAQTAGRGRQGHIWCSPPGAGLYVSVILRPNPRAVPLLTITSGVAIAEGVRAATGLTPALKWPNDVMIPAAQASRAAKLAGILAEAGPPTGATAQSGEGQARDSGESPSHVVLGFGINVRPAAYPPDVAARATSLEGELGRPIDRGIVLAECLAALAARYDDLQQGRTAPLVAAWRALARPLLGRQVEWDARDGVRRGVAQDIDDTGALLVRSGDQIARLISGDIRWL